MTNRDSTSLNLEQSKANQFCRKKIDNPLTAQRNSLFTTLQHANLLDFNCFDETDVKDLAPDSCNYDSFPNFLLSELHLDAHDLWSIRNQLSQALKCLSSHGLYHKALNLASLFISSTNPIHIKLSCHSNSQVLLGFINSDLRMDEFFKKKAAEQEEVCFDDLIKSIVNSVLPYSIIDKNIVFTNPNTLERNDLESLKALICSIESETMFKSKGPVMLMSGMNFFFSMNRNERKQLFLSRALLFHIFTHCIKSKKPLLEYDVAKDLVKLSIKRNSKVANSIMNVSCGFREVLLQAFEFACRSGSHLFLYYDDHSNIRNQFDIVSSCSHRFQLQNHPILFSNWLKKFPITDVHCFSNSVSVLNVVDIRTVSTLKLKESSSDVSVLKGLSNVSTLSLPFSDKMEPSILPLLASFNFLRSLTISNDFRTHELLDLNLLADLSLITDLTVSNVGVTNLSALVLLKHLRNLLLYRNNLTNLRNFSALRGLTSLSLRCNNVVDINPLSPLSELSYLSLCDTNVCDLWPLRTLNKLFTLDIRRTAVVQQHQNVFEGFSAVKNVILPYQSGVFHLELPNRTGEIPDLASYSHCTQLRSINMANSHVIGFTSVFQFVHLERLDLSAFLPNRSDHTKSLSDISFLTNCVQLKELLLDNNKITDLYPLANLQLLHLLSLNNNPIENFEVLTQLNSLTSLSLKGTRIFDLWPFRTLEKLSFLDVRDTFLSKEDHRVVTGPDNVMGFIHSYKEGVVGIYVSPPRQEYVRIDISGFSQCSSTLKSLSISNCYVRNISLISIFLELETLEFSEVEISEYYSLYSPSFVTPCTQLKSLLLGEHEFKDLTPLLHLPNLNTLSVRVEDLQLLRPLVKMNSLTQLSVRYYCSKVYRKADVTGFGEVQTFLASIVL
ncbi:hypothetical protein RCL1_008268 [Eukaryota sp. TZLM3-RCL]